MAIPTKPSFLEVARMMNDLVPELSKNLKPLKPIFNAAKGDKNLANSLTEVGKRGKYFIEDWKFNQGKAGKVVNTVKKTADAAKKNVSTIQKVVKVLNTDVSQSKKLWNALLQKVGVSITGAAKIGQRLPALISIAGAVAGVGVAVAVNEIQGWRNDENEKGLTQLGNDVSKVLGKLNQYQQRIDTTNKAIAKANADLDSLSKQFFPLKKQIQKQEQEIQKTNKANNDTLYETRKGREILERKITDSNKKVNDFLYETRTVTQKLKADFNQQQQQINKKIADVLKAIPSTSTGVSNVVQNAINTAINNSINKVQKDISSIRTQVNNIKSQPATDINAIVSNAVNNVRNIAQQEINNLKNQITGLNKQLSGLQISNQTALTIGTDNVKSIAEVDKKADAAMKEAKNKGNPNLSSLQKNLDEQFNAFVEQNKKDLNIRDLEQSKLSKEFDKRISDFERQSTLTADQRFNEFVKSNNEALKVRDIEQGKLSKDFDKRIEDFKRSTEISSQQRFDELTSKNNKEITGLKQDIGNTKNEVDKLNTKIKEREDVDKRVEKKIDSLIPKVDSMLPNIAGIPLIAGKAASLIKPSIPTIPQITNAAATGVCRTTRAGGCMSKALNNQSNNIIDNLKNNIGDIINTTNAAANAAQLQKLNDIDDKLGDKVDGGISGFLKKNFEWLQLDRITNLLTLWVTIHNASMLSANLIDTLLSVIENGLTIIGIKDADGSAIDLNEILGKQIQDLIKGAIGENNYNELSAQWKRANIIYRGTANVLDAVTGLTNSVINGLEVVGSQVAKIGNALRWYGKVVEKAYETFNPNPNFKAGGMLDKIENLDDAADVILRVSTVPINVMDSQKQLIEAQTEFAKTLKEETKKGIEIGEAEKTKEKHEASKAVSSGIAWDINDVFSAKD